MNKGKLNYVKFSLIGGKERIITNKPATINKLSTEMIKKEHAKNPKLKYKRQDIGTLTIAAIESLKKKSDVVLDLEREYIEPEPKPSSKDPNRSKKKEVKEDEN